MILEVRYGYFSATAVSRTLKGDDVFYGKRDLDNEGLTTRHMQVEHQQ